MNLITKFRVASHRRLVNMWHWLWAHSDVGFRRMCVIASLHAQLVKCSSNDCAAIQRLNERMNLVSDVNAMKIPTLFGNVIWKNVPYVEKVDFTSDRMIHRIIRSTPCWLNYGTDEKLESDIRILLYYCAEVKCR